jgi:chloramphenicol O-acetyltransferase type B
MNILVKSLRALSMHVSSLRLRFPQYRIGRGSFGYGLKVHHWKEGATLRIGKYCSIAKGVEIYLGGEHRSDWVTTYPLSVIRPELWHIAGHPKTKGDVVIGNDVWIAMDAVILSGVTIGDGAVIGTRAVVGNDVPPYSVVAGNPAKVVRYRFDPATIERLLAVSWWNWPEARIAELGPKLLNSDIAGFLEAAEGVGTSAQAKASPVRISASASGRR